MEWYVALLNCEHFLSAHGLVLGQNCQNSLLHIVLDQPLLGSLDCLGAEGVQELPFLDMRVLGYTQCPALPLRQQEVRLRLGHGLLPMEYLGEEHSALLLSGVFPVIVDHYHLLALKWSEDVVSSGARGTGELFLHVLDYTVESGTHPTHRLPASCFIPADSDFEIDLFAFPVVLSSEFLTQLFD